jgi:2-polyprenyl-3-methyl-5-hydroxy-6-metoxy-1,4-benzoquinol methylase
MVAEIRLSTSPPQDEGLSLRGRMQHTDGDYVNTEFILEKMPFFFRLQDEPNNGELPDVLPFRLGVESQTGRIMQVFDERVQDALTRAYAQGSVITGAMDDRGIGKQYADDFMQYCLNTLGQCDLAGYRTLDVGCGSGYLAHRFNTHGAQAAGIDPGPQCREGAKRFNIKTVQGLFPSPELPGPFDCISCFAVLEHVRNLAKFLEDIKAHLAPGGRIILAVPDCEPFLVRGDISILLHEHWSYFTMQSLRDTLRHNLPEASVSVKKGDFGGTLYASICFMEDPSSLEDRLPSSPDTAVALFHEFALQSKSMAKALSAKLKEAFSQGKSIGLFVPIRAINALSMFKDTAMEGNLRFYDDDILSQNKFFPGFNIPIQSRTDLLQNPPDSLIIMSTTFGAKIAGELRKANLACPVTTISEIFEENS